MSVRRQQIPLMLLSALLTCLPASLPAREPPDILLPKARLQPQELGVIVNDADPLSVRIAEYYLNARDIPRENLIHVELPPKRKHIKADEFEPVHASVREQTPEQVQAYALTWAQPYRAGCMSITTAFAMGFDSKWCTKPKRKCTRTAPSPYYTSPSVRPWDDLEMRPTVAIAALTFEDAAALIDRGVASDGSWPEGTAYLLDTSDPARTVRAHFFPKIREVFGSRLNIEILEQDYLYNRDDILFYFTGHKRIKGLETLGFVPGAIADHLTSGGGQLTRDWQMSILRWLEAGATGSYGAAIEPCNFIGKFPNPGILMTYYLHGASLLEAYWKSVGMPGEGIVVGEPLAAPFSGYRLHAGDDHWRLETHQLAPGTYRLLTANSRIGPYRAEDFILRVARGAGEFRLPRLDRAVYRLQPMESP